MTRVKTKQGEYRCAIEVLPRRVANRDHYAARVTWVVFVKAAHEQEEIPVGSTPLREHWDEDQETARRKAVDEFTAWALAQP